LHLVVDERSSISGVGHMGGLNRLTSGLGDWVLNIGTGHLGDGVAVLNLNGDKLDLRVVNTVLSGDFTASVLDSGSNGVSNSVGNWSSNSDGSSGERSSNGSSIRMSSKELRISFSISFTLSNGVVSNSSRSIADGVNNFLADLLVFNLFGVNSLFGAHILGRRGTALCHKDFSVGFAVGSRNNCRGSNSSSVGSSCKELGISLSFGLWGCASKGEKTRHGKNLHHHEIVRYFPRWLVELK